MVRLNIHLIPALLSALAILTTAFPISNTLPNPLRREILITQQTLKPVSPPLPQIRPQNKKLCGVHPIYLYPCVWTTTTSISRLKKLDPVIFIKYIINTPGVLLDSILDPVLGVMGINNRRPDQNTRRGLEKESRIPLLLIKKSGLSLRNPNPRPSNVRKSIQRLRSSGDDITLYKNKKWRCNQENGLPNCVESSSGRLAVPQIFRLPTLVFGFFGHMPRVLATVLEVPGLVVNDTTLRDLRCQGGGDEPFHDCVSSSASSIRTFIVFAIPVVAFRAISSMPRALAATIPKDMPRLNARLSRLPPSRTQLEDSTKGTLTSETLVTRNVYCFWLGYVYPYAFNLTPPKITPHGRPTYESSARSARSIPRIFGLPTMLVKVVKAIPLSRSVTRPKYRPTRSRTQEFKNPRDTTAIPEPNFTEEISPKIVSREWKQCLVGIFLWPCWVSPPAPPPPPKKKCQVDEFTHHVICVEVPVSAARSTISVPRLFIWPAMLFKVVNGRGFDGCGHRQLQRAGLDGTSNNQGTSRLILDEVLRQFRRYVLALPVSGGKGFHALPRNLATSFSSPTSTKSKGYRHVIPRETPFSHPNLRFDSSCVISYPSSSTSLTPSSPFKLLTIIISIFPSAINALPFSFPRPAAITDSIADPNFDILRQSVGDVMDAVTKWIRKREVVDDQWYTDHCTTEQASFALKECEENL